MNNSIKYDNSKIEALGVNYLEDCINKSEYLRAYFYKNDKYPIWDGNILVYKTNPLTNSNLLGQIPVQIKTTTKKMNKTKMQNKSINRKILEIYSNDGGVLYLLICVHNEPYTILYIFKNI